MATRRRSTGRRAKLNDEGTCIDPTPTSKKTGKPASRRMSITSYWRAAPGHGPFRTTTTGKRVKRKKDDVCAEGKYSESGKSFLYRRASPGAPAQFKTTCTPQNGKLVKRKITGDTFCSSRAYSAIPCTSTTTSKTGVVRETTPKKDGRCRKGSGRSKSRAAKLKTQGAANRRSAGRRATGRAASRKLCYTKTGLRKSPLKSGRCPQGSNRTRRNKDAGTGRKGGYRSRRNRR